MAREIHDTLAQSFTGILLQLGVAKRIVNQQPEEAWSLIERVSELAHEGLMEARRSVWALHPQASEYSELANALTRSLEQMTEHTPVCGSVCIQGTPRALPPDLGMNLLRIGQEALTNALRHAQAQTIWLELTFEADQVRLRVQDDGQGFDPQADSGGFGLIGMRQRADRIGGQLTITSQPGQGTEVMVMIPI
jgi:signal transduction histidine kinase